MVSSKNAVNSPNAPLDFSHNQSTNAVRVDNIPEHVDRRELIAIFRSLIGEVHCFRDVKERNKEQLEITFHNRSDAAKALCMNGYSIGGASLSVIAVTLQAPRPKASGDDRRNLYVLGLPFALTKNEFTAIFARYGTVTHCVILATVDNSSRRRGFVVMSCHEEAKRALSALTRTQIKGHTIDVSWAVVQRSQGFLDGGDRSLLLDNRSSHLPGPVGLEGRGFSSSGSEGSEYATAANDSGARPSGMNTPVATTALLITNLPALLFSQIQDLHPLLCPFGQIERIQTVQIPNADTISAVVQYSTPEAALDAKASLDGQRYDNVFIETHFVHPSFGEVGQDLTRSSSAPLASLANRFSPRNSRAPTPTANGYGGFRKSNHSQMAESSFAGNLHPFSMPGEGDYSQRLGFSDSTEDRAPSSAAARFIAGASRAQHGYGQLGGQRNQFCGENGHPRYAP